MSLTVRFARALDALRDGSQAPIAVAYSGGLDSSALLDLAHAYGQQNAIPIVAFHVHHGISPNADGWLAHCESTCAALGVQFEGARVVLEKSKSGVEAAARKLRYAALGAMCQGHGIKLMLTAHHLDDQAETVLLQLLRGSGTAGLSGMDAANAAPELLGNPDLVMARPLLPVSRGELEQYVEAKQIAFVEDESNTHPRYARNALRHQVMPALAQAFPGYQERFARSAAHAQSAQRLLSELAEQDLASSLDGDCIDVARLRAMSLDRAYNMLRHWFALRQLRSCKPYCRKAYPPSWPAWRASAIRTTKASLSRKASCSNGTVRAAWSFRAMAACCISSRPSRASTRPGCAPSP